MGKSVRERLDETIKRDKREIGEEDNKMEIKGNKETNVEDFMNKKIKEMMDNKEQKIEEDEEDEEEEPADEEPADEEHVPRWAPLPGDSIACPPGSGFSVPPSFSVLSVLPTLKCVLLPWAPSGSSSLPFFSLSSSVLASSATRSTSAPGLTPYWSLKSSGERKSSSSLSAVLEK